MSFIITKKSNLRGKENLLYYFVENYREGKKIKRRTIFKLRNSTNLYDFYEIILKREQWLLGIVAGFEKQLNEVIEKSRQYPNFAHLNKAKKHYEELVEEYNSKLGECQQTQEKVKSFM